MCKCPLPTICHLSPLSFSMFLIFCSSHCIMIHVTSAKILEGIIVSLQFFHLYSLSCFWIWLRFHFYSYCKWPCDGALKAILNRRFCFHARAELHSQTIQALEDPFCWPPRYSASAARFPFTSYKSLRKRRQAPFCLAGCYIAPVDLYPCAQFTLRCAIIPL